MRHALSWILACALCTGCNSAPAPRAAAIPDAESAAHASAPRGLAPASAQEPWSLMATPPPGQSGVASLLFPDWSHASGDTLAHRIQQALLASEVTRHFPVAAVVIIRGVVRARVGLGGASPDARMRPGSTLKPILATIAADNHVAMDEPYHCRGRYAEGLQCFAAHGPLDLPHALEVSCNAFFYRVADLLGYEKLQTGLNAYGFSNESGSPPNLQPFATLQGKRDYSDRVWAPLVGTGHGPLHVSLSELAQAYWQLGTRLTSPGAPAAYGPILQGLRRVVAGEDGTGRAAAVPHLDLAGKTGTAESGAFALPDSESTQNAWFVGWAPASRPEVVVAVVALGAAPSSQSAAPLAGAVFQRLLEPEPAEANATPQTP